MARSVSNPRQEDNTREQARHVWLVNHHATVPSKDQSWGRHLQLAKYLPESGWTASLIVSSTVHASGKQALSGFRLKKVTRELGVKTLWIKTNAYGSSSTLRLIGMVVFALVLLIPGITRDLQRPSAVIGSTVHPLAAWAASGLARKFRVPFIFEIRDVWPDALVELGTIKKESLLARLLERINVHLISRSSFVMSPLPGVEQYIQSLGLQKKFLWLPNGIDDPGVLPNVRPNKEAFEFMYIGSFGNAMDLETILNAYEKFNQSNPEIESRLRLIGGGHRLREVQDFAANLSCSSRISFEPHVPKDQLTEKAQGAECLIHAMHDHEVYVRFGISPNKLYDYMLAARPVIFASNVKTNPIAEAVAGFCIEPEDANAMASAMLQIYALSEEDRKVMGERGRQHALSRYTYRQLCRDLAAALNNNVSSTRAFP